jgi:hypothetical protein
MDWVLLLVLILGWAVGWIQATGKVNFLELLVKPLEKAQERELQVREWQLQLNHHSDLVVEKETQLAQAHSALEKAMLRQSELEMALDLAHSKAMVQQKALDWDLQ